MSGAAPNTDVLNWAKVSRNLPGPVGDAQPIITRGWKYGELAVASIVPNKALLADEGTSFSTLTSQTPGTTLAYGSSGTQASFSATVPFIVIYNKDQPGGKSVILDYLKLIQIGGTAPATTTSVQCAVCIDTISRVPTSAASTFTQITPLNCRADGPGSIATTFWPNGAVATIPTSNNSTSKYVGRAQLKGGPTLVLDEHTIHFGSVDGAPSAGYLTTVSQYTTRMPQVSIPPQCFCVIHLWFPGGATNAYTFEGELVHIER